MGLLAGRIQLWGVSDRVIPAAGGAGGRGDGAQSPEALPQEGSFPALTACPDRAPMGYPKKWHTALLGGAEGVGRKVTLIMRGSPASKGPCHPSPCTPYH